MGVTLSISLHEISVGVYVPYLTNLTGLLDRASAYATDKKLIRPYCLPSGLHRTCTALGSRLRRFVDTPY